MINSTVLQNNLSAIRIRHPQLYAILDRIAPHPGLRFIESGKGPIVPVLTHNGRPFPLHSRFDPEEEGRRFANEASEGYQVIFGLGGAYHISALLQNPEISGILIIEKDITLIRGILEKINMVPLFSDVRVTLIADPEPEDCVQTVLNQYLPILYGGFGCMCLRSRFDTDPEWFSVRANAVRKLPDILGRDYTVQVKFGRRWFINTVLNLAAIEKKSNTIPQARQVLVTAAGPSLQDQLPSIRKHKKDGALLLATDTSLPVLVASDMPPDIVLSIDCQTVSYNHFMQGLPDTTLLVLDFASPPVLFRLTDNVIFCANNHPFAQYINSYFRKFPIIDNSGGNVTHAALSLAQTTGAEEIRLFGVDFSWPQGIPYARGTYIFPYFQSRSNRIIESESQFWKFMQSARPWREPTNKGWRWRTTTLDSYRNALEVSIATMATPVIPETGGGVPITCIQGYSTPVRGRQQYSTETDSEDDSSIIASPGIGLQYSSGIDFVNVPGNSVGRNWFDFLTEYSTRLEKLPLYSGHPQNVLEKLSSAEKQVWATLLPVAASFRNSVKNGHAAIEMARKWILDSINYQEPVSN